MTLNEFFDVRMKALYRRMEDAYATAQAAYEGFACRGCADNCCTQRFHHRTYAEYYHLLSGMRELLGRDPDLALGIVRRAASVVDAYMKEIEIGEMLPLMCPANVDGLCALYEHRPMICHMHGLPHVFRMPNGQEARGGGCHRFEAAAFASGPVVDRTELYRELAALEQDVRAELGPRPKYKKTTAEMILDIAGELGPGSLGIDPARPSLPTLPTQKDGE